MTCPIYIQLISKIVGSLRNIEWKIRDPTVTNDTIHRITQLSISPGRWLVSAKLSKTDNVIPKPEIATYS